MATTTTQNWTKSSPLSPALSGRQSWPVFEWLTLPSHPGSISWLETQSYSEEELNRLRGFWDFFKAFLYYKIVGVSFSLVTELPTHSRQALDEITIEKLQRMVRVSRVTFDEYENVLDWDARIEHPPLRPAGTIQVKLEYKGRSKPIPVTDPWSE